MIGIIYALGVFIVFTAFAMYFWFRGKRDTRYDGSGL